MLSGSSPTADAADAHADPGPDAPPSFPRPTGPELGHSITMSMDNELAKIATELAPGPIGPHDAASCENMVVESSDCAPTNEVDDERIEKAEETKEQEREGAPPTYPQETENIASRLSWYYGNDDCDKPDLSPAFPGNSSLHAEHAERGAEIVTPSHSSQSRSNTDTNSLAAEGRSVPLDEGGAPPPSNRLRTLRMPNRSLSMSDVGDVVVSPTFAPDAAERRDKSYFAPQSHHKTASSGKKGLRRRGSVRNWMESFTSSDPRKQLANFFMNGDNRGPLGYLLEKGLPKAADPAAQSQHFAVYRPTSMDAIRMMMTGMATGKGLNVKGKSSKKGKLSGYVLIE